MTKLYLDLGNTSLKIFNYDGVLVYTSSTLNEKWQATIADFLKKRNVDLVVISSVASEDKLNLLLEKLRGIPFQLASYELGCWSIEHSYLDPAKLGIDRLLAMEAAFSDEQSSLVVIDCGSAITIDVVTDQGVHQGGYIVPGYRLQLESLLSGTALLFEEVQPKTCLGLNTAECIQNGTLRMVESFCKSIINEYNPDSVILTGGDLKGSLSALKNLGRVDDGLVFKGLKVVYG